MSSSAYTFCLEGLSTCIEKLFITRVVTGLCWACPNYLRRIFLNLSLIGATPKCSRMCSFLILSFLVFTTRPSHYSHLCYTHFVNVLFSKRPTLLSIGHSWANHCIVKFFLQFYQYTLIIKRSRNKSPLQPSSSYPMFDILLDRPSFLIIEPRYWKEFFCGISWASILIGVTSLYTSSLKL